MDGGPLVRKAIPKATHIILKNSRFRAVLPLVTADRALNTARASQKTSKVSGVTIFAAMKGKIEVQ